MVLTMEGPGRAVFFGLRVRRKGLDPVQLWREVDAQEPESQILFTGGEGVDGGSGMSSLAMGMRGHEVAL